MFFRLQEEYKTELQSQISQIESEHQRDKDLEMKLACSVEEIQKLVQEKNDLQDQLAFQKEEILAEYEQEQCELKNELESTLVGTESAIKQLEKEKVQLSSKIGDMSKQFELEKLKIQENFERELQKQENEYRRDLQDFENIFAQVKYCCYIYIHDNLINMIKVTIVLLGNYWGMHACAISKWQGEIGLKGKLREDFYELLEKHKTDIMKTQKEAMMKDLQKERLSMEKAFAQQKTQMGKTLLIDIQWKQRRNVLACW